MFQKAIILKFIMLSFIFIRKPTRNMTGLLFFVINFLILKTVTSSCNYPNEVYGTKYLWKIMSPDYDTNFPHSYRQVRFSNSTMVVYLVPREEEAKAIVYTCEEGFNRERFMVSRHENGRNLMFTCLQFIIRSRNVIQLKMADMNRVRSPALCGEAYMKLVPAPLVYFHTYDSWVKERLSDSAYHPCPLQGGFILREWTNEQGRPAYEADTLMPPIKMENECEKGEGIKFVCDKNHAKCPLPHSQLHQGNNFCLASWMDDEYTYMVIYNADDDRMVPCIRYRNNHRHKFTAYMFLDGVCDHSQPITRSKFYRKLSLSKETESYCGDRTKSCANIDRSRCRHGLADYCRFTCRSCSNPSAAWTRLRVHPDFRGTWVKDTLKMGYENVVFDETQMHIPSLGKYRLYEKYWYHPEDDEPYGQDQNYVKEDISVRKEYLMVSTYSNGCSPRATLLNVVKRSDSVISVRISLPHVIEKFSQTPKDLESMDKLLNFRTNPKSNVFESYRPLAGNWFNLVRYEERLPTTSCSFDFTFFRLVLKDGRLCEGAFEHIDGNNFEMVFKACNSTTTYGELTEPPGPLHFECLALFDGSDGSSYLITGVLGRLHDLVKHEHVCWAFSQYNLGVVYWMRVSECDSSTEDYIARGLRTPLAKLTVEDTSHLKPASTYMRWIICFMVFFMWLFGI